MIQITTDQYQSYQLYPEFLKSYLIKNNLLDSRQSGFRSLRSTVIPILDLIEGVSTLIGDSLVNFILRS